MLMQNFKSASDLEISEEQRSALIKVLVLLETGNLVHVSVDYKTCSPYYDHLSFCGLFNMSDWISNRECGTVCCIGGAAELVGGVSFASNVATHATHTLRRLFYPKGVDDWNAITSEQAACALRNYLTIGEPKWESVVA